VARSLGAFVRLSRPKFLAGGIAGGALGTALAAFESGTLDWRAYAFAQVTISSFHLMTQYANEYFDRDADRLAVRTPFSGGSGALVDGSVAPVVALRAALVCASSGVLGTFALLSGADRPLAAGLAVAIGVLGWSYSAPPLRLLARGLGEADTALVVAVLVPLCAFAAQGRTLDARAFASTLPAAAAMFAMMLAVEFPDAVADAAAGKRNLLVRYGPRAAARLGILAIVAVYAAAVAAVAFGAPPAFGLGIATTVPLALGSARALRERTRPEFAADAALAGRGVAFFFVVAVMGALAYAAAPGVLNRAW
jgi:1,4-dihydroxy-2-naphthoate octaprenyltransferase